MKCKACNGTLSSGEQTLDARTKELNDICNECLMAGMNDSEFDMIKCAIDMVELDTEDLSSEPKPADV